MAKSRMGQWERGPKHGRGTVHKIRHREDGEISEEVYTPVSFYAFALTAVAVCAAGWWWQLHLDSWVRSVVLGATVLLTLYMIVVFGGVALMTAIARFVTRRL